MLAKPPVTGVQEKADEIQFFIEVDTMAWVDCMYPLTAIEIQPDKRESRDESKNIVTEVTVVGCSFRN